MVSFAELDGLLSSPPGGAALRAALERRASSLESACVEARAEGARPSAGAVRELCAELGLGEAAPALLPVLADHLDVSLDTAAHLLSRVDDLDDPRLVSDEGVKAEFLREQAAAFRAEQRWAGRCLSRILQTLQADDHPLAESLSDFVSRHLDSGFLGRAVKRLKLLREGPAKIEARHSILLQSDIIRSLLWYFHVQDFGVGEVVDVMEMLKAGRWGRRQPLARTQGLLIGGPEEATLGRLSILLGLQLLDPESAGLYLQGKPEAEQLRACLEGLDGTEPNCGPTLAAWAALLSEGIFPAADSEEVVRSLGCLVRDLDVPAALTAVMADPLLQEDADLRQLGASVLYGFLDAFLGVFEAASLGPWEDIVAPLAVCLAEEPIANVFWSQEFANGAGEWIRDLFYRFPFAWSETVPILSALLGANATSARKALALLQRLPVFTEDLRTLSAAELEDVGSDDDSVYRLLAERRPLGLKSGVVIPAGTIGTLIPTNSCGFITGFIQWTHFHNGWEVCLHYAKAMLKDPSGQEEARRGAQVFRLVRRALSGDAAFMAPKLGDFLSLALHICRERAELLVSSEDGRQTLVTLIDCLSFGAGVFHAEILTQLGGVDLAAGADTDVLSALSRLGIAALEAGANPDIDDFLHRLLDGWLARLDHGPLEVPSVPPSVSVDGGLSQMASSERLLRLLLRGLRGPGRPATLGALARPTGLAFLIACLGEDVRQLTVAARDAGPEALELKCVALGLSLLSQCLEAWEAESAEMDQLAALLSAGVPSPLATLASYVAYSCQFDLASARLGRLSLLCLRKVGSLGSPPLLSSLGEVAAAQLVAGTLASLPTDRDPQIQALKLISGSLERQPGLGERFLSVREEEPVLLAWLWAQLQKDDHLPQLLEAVYALLLALWRRRHKNSMDWLCGQSGFWGRLSAPLSAEESNFYLRLVTGALRLIAEELSASPAPSPELRGVLEAAEGILSEGRLGLVYAKLAELLKSSIPTQEKAQLAEQLSDFLTKVADGRIRLPEASKDAWLKLHWTLLREFSESLTVESFEGVFPLVWSLSRSGAFLVDQWLCSSSGRAAVESELLGAFARLSSVCPAAFLPTLCKSLLPPIARLLRPQAPLGEGRLRPLMSALHSLLEKLLSLHFELRREVQTAPVQARLFDATTGCLLLLQKAQEQTEEEAFWLSELHRHATLRALCSLLTENCAWCPVSLLSASLGLLAQVLRCAEGLGPAEASGLLDLLSLGLLDRVEAAAAEEAGALLWPALEAQRAGLATHAHRFLAQALTFVGAYRSILQTLLRGCGEGSPVLLSSAISATSLLQLLAAYRSEWIRQLGDAAFAQIRDAVRAGTRRLIGLLSRPGGLLQRSGIRGGRSEEGPLAAAAAQGKSVELLLGCLCFLRALSPALATLLAEATLDVEAAEVVLSLDFASAVDVDEERELGFGALFLAVQTGASALRRSEGRPSSSGGSGPRAALADRELLAAASEMGLELVLSQAGLCVASPGVAAADKETLKRELASELVGVVNRSLRLAGGSPLSRSRSPRSSTRSASPKSPGGGSASLFSAPFLRTCALVLETLINSPS